MANANGNIGDMLTRYRIQYTHVPVLTYRKQAVRIIVQEVTCGGIDTRALSSKTMECNDVPGLYFIGEVVDVTGQLGGYNFQWAWASGYAAGQAI